MLRLNYLVLISKVSGFGRKKIVAVSLATLCFVLTSIALPAFEINGLNLDRSSRKFEHWNTKQKKITGYTHVSYSIESESGSLVEYSANLDRKQQIYSEKRLWFEAVSGHLIKYQESDYRTELTTTNTYSQGSIHTEIKEKEKTTTFDIAVTPELVPFELLSHYLQSSLDEIQQKKSLSFVLYLPVIAFEVSKSLSQLEMVASIVKTGETETPFGKKKTVTIRVEPTSFLIKALLPSEKSRFDFTYTVQHPHLLVLFEEGETQTRLREVQ